MEPTREEIDERWQALVDGRATRAEVHDWAVPRLTAAADPIVRSGLRHLHSFEQAWDPERLGSIVCGGPGGRLISDEAVREALGRWRARCLGAATQRLPVRNAGDEPVCLMLEPLGQDFWLRPGERVIVAGDEFDAQFEVETLPGHVIVAVTAGDPAHVDVLDADTGAVLPIGHGRPA